MTEPGQMLALGLDHERCPLALRERLSFTAAQRDEALRTFRGDLAPAGVDELVILSTCNRVELYAAGPGSDADLLPALVGFLATPRALDAGAVLAHLRCWRGDEAADHLLRVACGLESMVLGEPQILGQVTEAFMAAEANHASGPVLTTLFREAIRCGKRARHETTIGFEAASISSVAVREASRRYGDLSAARILLVGSGQMGQKAAGAFRSRGATALTIVNRTFPRAAAVAERYGAQARPWDELGAALAEADIVVSSTSAPGPIIGGELLRQAQSNAPARHRLLIDIAVPRDFAPDVALLPGVDLVDIDHLREEARRAQAVRRRQIPRVEAIIAEEHAALRRMLAELEMRDVIVDLRQHAESIRQKELLRAQRFLPELHPEDWQQIERFSRTLVNKLLHSPTVALRQQASGDKAASYAATARSLFGLDAETPHSEDCP